MIKTLIALLPIGFYKAPSSANWLYRLDKPFSVQTLLRPNHNYFIVDSLVTRPLAELRPDGLLVIYEGFAWDGCTPKFRVSKYLVGVWDGSTVGGVPETYYASLIHDALCQLLGLYPIDEFDRKAVDLEFKTQLARDRFVYQELYYGAVRTYGFVKCGLHRFAQFCTK